MARQEELEIRIAPDGKVSVEVRGAGGSRCLEFVEAFRTLLGPVEEQRLTPEYYEAEVSTHAQQQLHTGPGGTFRQ
jgi:hypothetical protein